MGGVLAAYALEYAHYSISSSTFSDQTVICGLVPELKLQSSPIQALNVRRIWRLQRNLPTPSPSLHSRPARSPDNGHSRPNNDHSYGYGKRNRTLSTTIRWDFKAATNGTRSLPEQDGGLSINTTHSPEPPIHSPVGRNGFDTQSDVYKMLQDYEEPVSEPKQSGSFKYLQGILEAEDGGVSPTERMRNLKSPVRSPIPKLGSPIPSPMSGLQKLPQCTRCCNGIV
ncbi:PDZ and LIM domain protein 4, partial [Lates japonicus]